MTHLDLFTGIGGFHLAASWAGFQTIGFSEIEPYCCELLKDKWPDIKNYGDLRTADFSELRGRVTVLSAGVPCQPASLAGKRRGAADDRWLWPAVLDVVGSVQPAWSIFENPPGILSLDEFEGILLRLESLGYQVRMFSVPANAVGAKHRRQRIFIVANCQVYRREAGNLQDGSLNGKTLADAAGARCTSGQSRESGPIRHGTRREESCGRSDESEALADAETRRIRSRMPQRETGQSACSGKDVTYTDIPRLQERQGLDPERTGSLRRPDAVRNFPRLTESPLCRRADGVRDRSHRLKALGNAVVPQQAYPFFEAIAQVEQ